MSTTEQGKPMTAQQEAIERIREWVVPGQTVYTILRHRSASGMQRVIQLLIMEADGPRYLGFSAAKALGYRYDREHEGIVIRGCGMDMGFDLVYQLGSVLWPQGTPLTHSTRNGQPDNSGGYALKQRWL